MVTFTKLTHCLPACRSKLQHLQVQISNVCSCMML